MNRCLSSALLVLAAAGMGSPAVAQQATITQSIAGTRLDVTATGEVNQVPDVAIVSAGLVSRAATATAALGETAERMQRVLAALKGAGVEPRDIQTSNVSLNPEYRYLNNEAPQLVGYTASNQVNVRFRDIRSSGKIIDALVAQGANQINGPNLTIDKPQAALDEARTKAIAIGRARAELYARSLGLRIVRIVAVTENGGSDIAPPVPVISGIRLQAAQTKIEAGEQKLRATVTMTFELQ